MRRVELVVGPELSALVTRALFDRIWEVANQVGLLRRRVEPETNLGFLADRLADNVSSVYLLLTPSAGELVSRWAPNDEEAASAAVDIVDREWDRLQRRLGRNKA
jgi:hypothetical protein